MTFIISDQVIGSQAIADTSTTKNHPLGSIVRAVDPTYGEGEFIYLLGVTGTLTGLMVTYNATTYQTALTPTAAPSAPYNGNSVAVAMSANVGSQYGWYQIGGLAVIKKTQVAALPQVPIFFSATAGRMKTLLSLGRQILGAKTANLTTVVSTTSTVVCQINRPFLQGQII